MASVTLPTTATLRSQAQDKVVLVTGAASGIGFAIARLFAEHGAKVVLVDIHRAAVHAAAEKIGQGSTPFPCDVSSWTQQMQLFEWVSQNVGVPAIVCLNAGVDPELATISGNDQVADQAKTKVMTNYLASEYERDQDASSFLKKPPNLIMDVNFRGVVYGLKLAIHHMVPKGGGRVIITGSAGSYTPLAHQDIYAASKHAVLGLIRSTSRRQELEKGNVSVSLIAPWLTTTPMTADISTKFTAETEESTAADVAWAVGHLATAGKEETNGACIWIKGKKYIEVEKSYESWLAQLMHF